MIQLLWLFQRPYYDKSTINWKSSSRYSLRFAIREGTLTIGGGYVVSLGSNLDTTQT